MESGWSCPYTFPQWHASMRPSPFGDGKGDAPAHQAQRQVASMRPSPFGDGKSTPPIQTSGPLSCFNEAIAFRRWKASPIPDVGWGCHSLQWSYRLSAMERRRSPPTRLTSPRFNVAIAERRWKAGDASFFGGAGIASMGPSPKGDGKRVAPLCTIDHPHAASMGPSPKGDGKLRYCPPSTSWVARFNEAIAFRRWKAGSPGKWRGCRPSCFNEAIAFRRWKVAYEPPGEVPPVLLQ